MNVKKDDSMNQTIDREINDVISVLKFLSKIQVGEIINTSGPEPSVGQAGYKTSAYRTLLNMVFRANETHTRMPEYIEKLTTKAISLLTLASPSSRDRLITALNESRAGIHSLQKTYGYDRMFVSKLQTLEEFLVEKLQEYGAE